MYSILQLSVQSVHYIFLALAVAEQARKALYRGAGKDVFGGLLIYAAALEVEERVLVKLADGRTVVADDVLLRAEDERHGLVHNGRHRA